MPFCGSLHNAFFFNKRPSWPITEKEEERGSRSRRWKWKWWSQKWEQGKDLGKTLKKMRKKIKKKGSNRKYVFTKRERNKV